MYLIFDQNIESFWNWFGDIRNQWIVQITKASGFSICLNPCKMGELGKWTEYSHHFSIKIYELTTKASWNNLRMECILYTTLSTETPKISVFILSNSAWRSLKAVISAYIRNIMRRNENLFTKKSKQIKWRDDGITSWANKSEVERVEEENHVFLPNVVRELNL